ncbi:helix-turn-helix domain-containing protein [Lactobacillus delbrueckii]|uniref:helix-turn-helix domain-containing protein n=1 Tax=Lactobacillus delbrueckii TaxID=1584 RepID=UPI000555E56F|nr:helix-turn-helix transcriptional regulator [Lactobacillus delbrueckii]MCD5516627.1 helix-turn-helix domain-containing protein [Lactobacillus delbrueckii subsp. lactis]MCD5522431.1 helix-turn-helix domain-containing protein [Lactobacillus delbrueckii subsp. lactis]
MGELLKNARLSLGLSQKEMAAEVMSVTQYSRIENDQQRIRFDDLVKILHAHQIDIVSFINQFLLRRKLTDCNHDYYLQKIESMYWERDLSSIDELLDKLKQFGQHGLLNLLTKLLIVNVKDSLRRL